MKSGTLQLSGIKRFSDRDGSYFRLVQRYQHHTGRGSNEEEVYTLMSLAITKHNHKLASIVRDNPSCIYTYSFALEPEKHQPSGTCNFSRLDSPILKLELEQSSMLYQDSTLRSIAVDRYVRVYAINYNVLRIMSGMGGLAYAI